MNGKYDAGLAYRLRSNGYMLDPELPWEPPTLKSAIIKLNEARELFDAADQIIDELANNTTLMSGYFLQTYYKFEVMRTWLALSHPGKDRFKINLLDCGDDDLSMTLKYDNESKTFSVSSTIGENASSLFEEAIFEHLKVYGVPYLPGAKFKFVLV